MKTFAGVLFVFLSINGLAQTSDSKEIDSLLRAPQTLELTISTPQPRMNQNFTLSLDINHIRANIFKSLIGKVKNQVGTHITDYSDFMVMNVSPVKKGWEEIGPLVFTINNTTYTTNTIKYEVVDALPNTDKGIWIRKVDLTKNEFCIIIEQRIPSNEVTTKTTTGFKIEQQPESEKVFKFKDTYSIDGLAGSNSSSFSDYSSVMVNGQARPFMYSYAIHYFTIEDPKAKIKITKNVFENIPTWYQFNDIVIQ